MNNNNYSKLFVLLMAVLLLKHQSIAQQSQQPNIIFVLADDLGYGDVRLLNPQGKIATPNMDRIGREGISFTDAHSSSAVCTPSRYSILTGRYAWRTNLDHGVLHGWSKPLIAPQRLTVASMLKSKGYTTACIGKWHLGLNWKQTGDTGAAQYDYATPIANGPTALGFDYFFGIAASLDMPPFIYIENDRTVGLPTATKKWGRSGPAAPDFDAENCVPDFSAKVVNFIQQKAKTKQPFFLYYTLPSPHTPIVVSNAFKGKSGVTDYGDYVMETDWAVGQMLQALDDNGIANNTIVVFTSDNGFAPYVLPHFNVEALGHYPSYIYRGYKADIWEGGHRIPLFVRWPGHIQAGSRNDATVCLSDFMATAAAITGYRLPDNAAEDSYNLLPYLTGKTRSGIRPFTVHHSIDGKFGIRDGNWKLELCPGSGGWAAPRDAAAIQEGLPAVQLYDLSNDIDEKNNVYAAHADVVKRLLAELEKAVKEGRSTPGPAQKNDEAVDIWKHKKNASSKTSEG